MLTLAIALLSPSLSPGNARQARVDIDITGDGRREIFIARDYQGFKAGDEFEILSPQSDGTLRPYGRLAFNLAIGFRVDGLKKRLIVLAPAAMGEATRIEYAIAPGLPKVASTGSAIEAPFSTSAIASSNESESSSSTRPSIRTLPLEPDPPDWSSISIFVAITCPWSSRPPCTSSTD